jgi:general secretion pathway protein D
MLVEAAERFAYTAQPPKGWTPGAPLAPYMLHVPGDTEIQASALMRLHLQQRQGGWQQFLKLAMLILPSVAATESAPSSGSTAAGGTQGLDVSAWLVPEHHASAAAGRTAAAPVASAARSGLVDEDEDMTDAAALALRVAVPAAQALPVPPPAAPPSAMAVSAGPGVGVPASAPAAPAAGTARPSLLAALPPSLLAAAQALMPPGWTPGAPIPAEAFAAIRALLAGQTADIASVAPYRPP